MQMPCGSVPCWFAPHEFLSLLFHTAQEHLLRAGPVQWAGPSHTDLSYGGIFSIKILSSKICLGLCQLTKTNQHRGLRIISSHSLPIATYLTVEWFLCSGVQHAGKVFAMKIWASAFCSCRLIFCLQPCLLHNDKLMETWTQINSSKIKIIKLIVEVLKLNKYKIQRKPKSDVLC